MTQIYYSAEVIQVHEETPLTRRFVFKVDPSVKFSFHAGQFVMIKLPLDKKGTNRSYSIASPPSTDTIFELVISLKADGEGTHYIWEHFKPGFRVEVSEPMGRFSLPAIIDRDLCFIATGTGIAPLRSMVLYLLQQHIPHKNIYLVFGTRTEQDLLYRKEFELCAEQHPEFTFIPVLSRETNPEWKGKLGYVHAVYSALFADKRPSYFYLCGWNAMVKEARAQLTQMGYDKEFIRFEKFD